MRRIERHWREIVKEREWVGEKRRKTEGKEKDKSKQKSWELYWFLILHPL